MAASYSPTPCPSIQRTVNRGRFHKYIFNLLDALQRSPSFRKLPLLCPARLGSFIAHGILRARGTARLARSFAAIRVADSIAQNGPARSGRRALPQIKFHRVQAGRTLRVSRGFRMPNLRRDEIRNRLPAVSGQGLDANAGRKKHSDLIRRMLGHRAGGGFPAWLLTARQAAMRDLDLTHAHSFWHVSPFQPNSPLNRQDRCESPAGRPTCPNNLIKTMSSSSPTM